MKPLINLLTLGLIACPILMAADKTQADETSKPISKTASTPEAMDMLRFANHDTLHGSYLAFGPKDTILWQSLESTDPIPFNTKKIQRIVLNHSRAHKAIKYKSAIHLVNGDVIPGVITSADNETVTLKTEHLGTLTIQRENISTLSPSPFSGKLLYYGPLNTEGWKTVSPNKPKEKKADQKKDDQAKDTKPDPEEEKKQTNWKHIANAWYAGTDKNKYLVMENALPDQCRLSFKLAWRGTLYTNVILHADFDPPEKKETDENPRRTINNTPGHAYILNITTHSASLSSLTYDENGKTLTNRFDETRASLRLSGKDETQIELRLDRTNKSILLFSDGSFKAKWSLGDKYEGKGNALAFNRNSSYSNSEIRISDIAISHWNGMKDSAQSMSTPKRDVILLNNGVDRFSGMLKGIRDGQVSFFGSYNNEMTIPLDEVQEIHLATNQQKPPPKTAKTAIYFFVYPYGRITGSPTTSQNGKTKLTTELLGEVELDVRYINIIDFSHKNSLLDIWDDNF